MKKIQSQMSIDAKALMDHLRKVVVGGTATYEEMSRIASKEITKNRGCMYTATNALLREGIRFDSIRSVGLRRMTDSEVARSGTRAIRLVGRKARRESRKMVAIKDFDGLCNEDKIQHNATLSVLGAISHFSRPTQVKILEAAVAEAHKRLPPSDSVGTIFRALAKK